VKRVTEAEITETTWYLRLVEIVSDSDDAEERYLATVNECVFSDCTHFDAITWRCSLKICAYDLKDDRTEPDDWEEGEFEWEE